VPTEQQAGSFEVGNINLGAKYRPHMLGLFWAHASLQRLPRRNQRARRVWEIFREEFQNVAGIRPIEILPEAIRGGYYAFVFDYEGAQMGGLGTEEFVKAVQAEGAPLDVDQYRGALLHTLPLFTSMDRRKLGGGLYDPTRPWEENLSQVALPETERVGERLVRFPPVLYGVRESYVRDCARAVKKVLAASLPAARRESPAPVTEPRASSGD